jgi:hypothetical protein
MGAHFNAAPKQSQFPQGQINILRVFLSHLVGAKGGKVY